MFAGWTLVELHWPVLLTLGLVVLLGMLMGGLNGWLTVRTGINSFIVTLALSYVYMGLLLILTRGHGFSGLPVLPQIGSRMVYQIFSPMLIVPLVLGLGLFLLYRHSVLGQQMLATGANLQAARMSGLPVDRVLLLSHVISGALTALAAIMETARLAAALPIVGEDWLLPAFLLPVLGGTLLNGGHVSVGGTLLGALLVATLQNGLQLFQVGTYWVRFFLGLMLLIVVTLDWIRTRYSNLTGYVSRKHMREAV